MDSATRTELKMWARLEQDVVKGNIPGSYFRTEALARLAVTQEAEVADPVVTSLAIRIPYAEILEPIKKGGFNSNDFTNASTDLLEDHMTIGQTLLSQYSQTPEEWRVSYTGNEARKNLAGYFGELSFQLLMLFKARNTPLVSVPSSLFDDLFPYQNKSGSNKSYDSLVLHEDQCHKVQVKSTKNKVAEDYDEDIVIIDGNDLSLEQDPALRLPLTEFERFTRLNAGNCSRHARIRTSNRASKLLTKVCYSPNSTVV